MTGLVLIPLLISFSSVNLITNPGFDQGLDGWSLYQPVGRIEPSEFNGDPCARVIAPPTAEGSVYITFHQEISVQPGECFEAGARVYGINLSGGNGGYISMDYLDENSERILFTQGSHTYLDRVWTDVRVRSSAPEGARRARMVLVLNGRGEVLFDDAYWRRLPAPAVSASTEPVILEVSDAPLPHRLAGFGFEDDGWFYAPVNREQGVDESDALLREERIRWMDPDLVRMFFWHKDWNPEGDWERLEFNSPNMQSHYRTLDLYQELGTPVIVTGVEWGMNNAYDDPVAFARALGDLFHHLIQVKGYTVARYWTLTNEPDGWFRVRYPLDHFVRIHRLVREELDRRDLPVQIVGSDEAATFGWFEACIEDATYSALTDVWASHLYLQTQNRKFSVPFLSERRDALAERGDAKPLWLTEFGFQDGRSSHLVNPAMDSHEYALWTLGLTFEGLNCGVSGFCIWCIHEIYYPGGSYMNYGLWKYKDHGWKPRPVFSAWSMMTRETEAGEEIRAVHSSSPGRLLGACVGDNLFWVNLTDDEVQVNLEGIKSAHAETWRLDLSATSGAGTTPLEIEEGSFRAPPSSFGCLEVR